MGQLAGKSICLSLDVAGNQSLQHLDVSLPYKRVLNQSSLQATWDSESPSIISNSRVMVQMQQIFNLNYLSLYNYMKKSRVKNKQTPNRKDLQKLKEGGLNVIGLRESTVLPRATSNEKAMSTRSKTIANHKSVQKLWSLTPEKHKEKESPSKAPIMKIIYEKKNLNKTKKKNKDVNNTKEEKDREKDKEKSKHKEREKQKDKQKDKDKDKDKEKETKQKRKKQNYQVCLRELKPLNLQKEKDIFFTLDCNYNPFFLYNNINPMSEHDKDYKAFNKPHDKYIELAVRILQKSISQKIDYPQKLKSGAVLSVAETSKQFDEYIKHLEIENLIVYEFMEHTVAPTSVIHNNNDGLSKVVVGLPIQYRENTIRGVLNHEIGTHFIRKYNNRLQKWHKERKKYGLDAFLKYEEGLAALNQLYETACNEDNSYPPMLYPSALHYYSCYQASRMSFSELFNDLIRYQADPELRWRECVRVKRGIANTQQHSGMYKDQIYLRGAIKILKHRKQLSMIDMHCGKLNIKDCMKMGEKKLISHQKIKLPYFLNDLKKYHAALDRIAYENGIDEWWATHQDQPNLKNY